MSRDRRLDSVAAALPSISALRITEAEARIEAGTATRSDFELVQGPQLDEVRKMVPVGAVRVQRARHTLHPHPTPTDPLAAASHIVSYDMWEEPPDELLDIILEAERHPGPDRTTHQRWRAAHLALLALGEDHGRSLRDELDRNRPDYDFYTVRATPEMVAERAAWRRELEELIEAGTATRRDFLLYFMDDVDLHRAELMVEAIGRRRAREAGSPILVEEPTDYAAEIFSYPPAEAPPPWLYRVLTQAAAVRVEPGTPDHADWVELNRCLLCVGRDEGRRVRQIIEDHPTDFVQEFERRTAEKGAREGTIDDNR
jgi:hypothetical protein